MAKQTYPSPTRFDIELVKIPLDEVIGVEKETAEFLEAHEYVVDSVIDRTAWDLMTLHSLYLLAPMLLLKREEGYFCLGSGRSWLFALEIFEPTDEVFALVINSGRLKTEAKFKFLAADLFGFPTISRTRRFVPRQLRVLWNAMRDAGIKVIVGEGPKAFSRATGYSLRALPTDSPDEVGKATDEPTANPDTA